MTNATVGLLACVFEELNVGVRFAAGRNDGTMAVYVKEDHVQARCQQDEVHRGRVGELYAFDQDAEVYLLVERS